MRRPVYSVAQLTYKFSSISSDLEFFCLKLNVDNKAYGVSNHNSFTDRQQGKQVVVLELNVHFWLGSEVNSIRIELVLFV